MCEVPTWKLLLIFACWTAHAVAEYWLGKTEKTKAGSVVELLLLGATAIALFWRKKNER